MYYLFHGMQVFVLLPGVITKNKILAGDCSQFGE
jgi:hypothetical protein